ncbi:MAG TPA: DUF3592 domain-containing protein [Puia sp.]|nr:DUF3592 domain-containing protein [Puia sp.]
MYLRKSLFFALVAIAIAAPFWTVRSLWVIRSVKATGVFGFAGNGYAGDQVRQDYSVISFVAGNKEIWFNGLGNLGYKPGQCVPVRYQPDDPYDARVDIFAGIWGDVLVYSGILVFLLLILFLHSRVVPWGSRVRVMIRRPFLQIIPAKASIVSKPSVLSKASSTSKPSANG